MQTRRKIGLARALSKMGYCSRSQAVVLVRAGRVQVNGTNRRDPETAVDMSGDRITVDEKEVAPEKKTYLMLNKPRGLVTTASDEKGRETVYSILQGHSSTKWLAPVGRLDKASEGLLLMTNDSEWGARIAAPETHLPKTYHAQIGVVADDALIEALRRGIRNDGELLCAKDARILRFGEKNCWLEVVLDEGKNRHIRRMLEHFGIEVLRLIRVAIGPLTLGTLAKGTYRELTPEEKRAIDRAMRRVEPAALR